MSYQPIPRTFPTDGWIGRLAREGQISQQDFTPSTASGANYSNGTHPTVTANTFTTLSTANVPLGRCHVMLEARIGADGACAVAFQQGQSSFSAAIAQTAACFDMIGTNGGSVKWTFEGGLIVPENCIWTLGYTCPTTTAPFTAGGCTWLDVTADFAFDSQYTILFVGDSITYAQSAGTNGTSQMNGNNGFPMLIRNHLLSRGVSARHVNKGVSGMTSQQSIVRLNDNSFYHCIAERDRVALIVDLMGMNDGPANTTNNQFNTYLSDIQSLQGYYPNADILYVGPTSTDDATRTTFNATARTLKSAFVTNNGGSSKGLYYVDGSSAYGNTAGDITTYFAETGGTHIHPNIAGHSAIASVIGTAIAGTRTLGAALGGTW